MAVDYSTIRRRSFMEAILLSLACVYEANADVRLTARHIFKGLGDSTVPPTDEEAQAALSELIDRELVSVHDDDQPVGMVPQKVYRITTDGLDFKRHVFPWDFLDRFSGPKR